MKHKSCLQVPLDIHGLPKTDRKRPTVTQGLAQGMDKLEGGQAPRHAHIKWQAASNAHGSTVFPKNLLPCRAAADAFREITTMYVRGLTHKALADYKHPFLYVYQLLNQNSSR
eukprot:273724-Pelagomonas_calceolata.AAC.3